MYPHHSQHIPGGGSTATTTDSERLITPTDDVLSGRRLDAKDITGHATLGVPGPGFRESKSRENGVSNGVDAQEGEWAEEALDLDDEVEDHGEAGYSNANENLEESLPTLLGFGWRNDDVVGIHDIRHGPNVANILIS